MTDEKPENNGNQTQETQPATDSVKTSARSKKTKEVVALSVPGKSDKAAQGLNLFKQSEVLPEHRPIGVSHLEIKETDGLPGNRPIEASHLKVVSTYTSVGGSRPVVASDMEVSSSLAISGNRPIAVSHLQISETYSVMGNRPVASNEIDDPTTLMGYLD